MRKTFLASSAITLVILTQTAPVQAQSVQSEPASPPTAIVEPEATDNQNGLNDIIVTAQRKTESAQKAGVAISVISADDVTRQGVTQPDQLGKLVPALNVQSGGGANQSLFVRGVGNFTVNGYSDPAIAVNLDGVYLGRPTSFSGVFYDLERVEVLKGPQGTLYGRNATGGAINIIPAKPRPGEFSGFVTASYGNYDAFNIQGAVNVPLGDKGAFRVSGTLNRHDGYLTDGTSDEKSGAFRVQLAAELTPNLKIRVSGDYSHAGGIGGGANYAGVYNFNTTTRQYVFAPSGLSPDVGLLDPRAQAYRQTLFLPAIRRNAGPLDDNVYNRNDYFGANAEINWKTGIGTFTVIPAWRYAKLNNRFDSPAFIGFIQEKDEQFSLEARLNGNRIGIFDYILGGYYYKETNNGNYTFAQSTLNAVQDFVNKTESVAAFGRVVANLTDKVRIIGGARFTQDHKYFNGLTNVVIESCIGPQLPFVTAKCAAAPLLPTIDRLDELKAPFVVPAAPFTPTPLAGTTLPGPALILAPTVVNQPLNASRVTWRGAVEYDLGPRSLAYASVETGYRSGGFSLAYGYETYQPEYITAYTVGVKNRFLDNRVQLNIEGFLWKYTNQQVSHGGLDKRGNSGLFTENIGRSTIKGVEVEAQVLATRNTLLRADVQYIDSVYNSFVLTQSPAVTGGTALTGCAQTPAGTLFTVDCSGKPGFNSPKWTINLSAQQTIPLGSVKLVGGLDTQFKTSRYVQVNYLPEMLAPSEWTTNAQLTLAQRDDTWSITAFIRNIENKRRVIATQLWGSANSLTEIRTAPRTYGVRANVKF